MTLENLSGMEDVNQIHNRYTLDEIYESVCRFVWENGYFTIDDFKEADYSPEYLTVVNRIKQETDLDNIRLNDVLHITGGVNAFHSYKLPDFNAWHPGKQSQFIAQLIWDITKDNITVKIKHGRLVRDIDQMEFYDLVNELEKRLDDTLEIKNIQWFIRTAGIAGWIDVQRIKKPIDDKRLDKLERSEKKRENTQFEKFGGNHLPEDRNKPEKFNDYF